MAKPFVEFLLNTFASALEAAYEPKFVAVLQRLHDKDANLYQAAILSLNEGIKALVPIVNETPTKLDDGLIDAIAAAIHDSASANGVALPVSDQS